MVSPLPCGGALRLPAPVPVLIATLVLVLAEGAAAADRRTATGLRTLPAAPAAMPGADVMARTDPAGTLVPEGADRTAPRAPAAPHGSPATGPEAEEAPPDGTEGPVPFRFDATPPGRRPGPAADGALPEIHYGEAGLPEAVARTRAGLIAAARTGEVEALRPVFDRGTRPPIVAFAPVADPVEHLRRQSGDPEGREILAILIELLSAGWVRVDAGTPRETYVWPYFAHVPLGSLTPPQEVELYKIVTAVDVEEMEVIGGWAFYRVGIAPDGTIRYFSAEGF